MPYYEVIVNVPFNFCVKAKEETEAEEKALDHAVTLGDNDAEIDTIDDLDEKEDAEIIQQFKDQGQYLK